MRLYAKAVAILIMFLFLMASVVPIIDGNIGSDAEPPITSIFFDEYTGTIILVAQTYPLNKGPEVKATYYKIDGGTTQIYLGPFQLPEGTHTVYYWSVDIYENTESGKSSTFTVDTEAPTVEITSPEAGGIYFHGQRLLTIGKKATCIGKVPIMVIANDETTGVDIVFFNIGNDTGFDSTAPFEYTYKGIHFGELTITVTAVDKMGLISEPDTMTINFYSLGIL